MRSSACRSLAAQNGEQLIRMRRRRDLESHLCRDPQKVSAGGRVAMTTTSWSCGHQHTNTTSSGGKPERRSVCSVRRPHSHPEHKNLRPEIRQQTTNSTRQPALIRPADETLGVQTCNTCDLGPFRTMVWMFFCQCTVVCMASVLYNKTMLWKHRLRRTV